MPRSAPLRNLCCPRCETPLGSVAGPYAVVTHQGRSYALQGLRVVGCDQCGTIFSPKGVVPRSELPRDAEEAAAALPGCVPLLCPTPDCRGKVLGQVAPDGRAVIAYRHRLIVADRTHYASCDRCRQGFEVPPTAPYTAPVAPVAPLTAVPPSPTPKGPYAL